MLDLFAGSGALAIEALSRGAASATLVDSSPAAVAAIRRNLAATRLEAEVVRLRAAEFLGRARAAAPNTIWCSSIPHTARRAPSERGSQPRWLRCSAAMLASSPRAIAGSRWRWSFRYSTSAATARP